MSSPSTTSYAKILGGSLYVSTAVIPTILHSSSEVTILSQWIYLFNSGKRTFPPLAIFTSLAFSYVAWKEHQIDSPIWVNYAVSSACTVAIIPFTLVAMMGNIKQLQKKGKAIKNREKMGDEVRGEPSTEELVKRWASLNLVRGVMHAVAFLFAAGASVVHV
ncbi:hypothetical protein RUND412_001552 [Rhizina undulata]